MRPGLHHPSNLQLVLEFQHHILFRCHLSNIPSIPFHLMGLPPHHHPPESLSMTSLKSPISSSISSFSNSSGDLTSIFSPSSGIFTLRSFLDFVSSFCSFFSSFRLPSAVSFPPFRLPFSAFFLLFGFLFLSLFSFSASFCSLFSSFSLPFSQPFPSFRLPFPQQFSWEHAFSWVFSSTCATFSSSDVDPSSSLEEVSCAASATKVAIRSSPGLREETNFFSFLGRPRCFLVLPRHQNRKQSRISWGVRVEFSSLRIALRGS